MFELPLQKGSLNTGSLCESAGKVQGDATSITQQQGYVAPQFL